MLCLSLQRMMRHYVRTTEMASWNIEALQGAMEHICLNKLSLRQAEKNYGIP
jgi:hypothetical protein